MPALSTPQTPCAPWIVPGETDSIWKPKRLTRGAILALLELRQTLAPGETVEILPSTFGPSIRLSSNTVILMLRQLRNAKLIDFRRVKGTHRYAVTLFQPEIEA